MRARLAVGVTLLLLVLGTGFDPWQTTWRETRRGNRALAEGNPEEAVRHYTEALSRSPDDPRILFDLGNALARAGRLDEARQAWERAASLGKGRVRRDAWYNRGLAELLGGNAQAAAESFTRALVVDPSDGEARRNLDLALRRLQQQQQRKQQGGGKGRQERQDQRQDRGRKGQEGRQGRERREGQEPGPPRNRPRENRQGNDRRPSPEERRRQEGNGAERQEPRPGPGEKDRERQPGAPPGTGTPDREADEMAERLLRRLARDEKAALRRALRRRIPAGRKRKGKDW